LDNYAKISIVLPIPEFVAPAGAWHYGGMTRPIDLRVLELLAARLCHDLIGPVAAIGNGVELLADDEPDFVRDAVALVGESARKANARLQFYRFAYGFSGGGLTGPPPHQLAREFFAQTSVVCEYTDAARALPLEWQKLACNMIAIAGEALPRGGRLMLAAGPIGPELDAVGDGVGPSAPAQAALSLVTPLAELNSRSVGAYFTGVLAAALGCRLILDIRPGGFRLATAVAAAG
jgi:histidine phosphotransferase ChpT